MKRSVGLVFGALLLAAVGGVCVYAGLFERRMGIAAEDTAVLDFEDPQADYAVLQQELEKLPWSATATLKDIRLRRASLQYWQRDYKDLVEMTRTPPAEGAAADPDLLAMAANASYRTAQLGPQDKATLIRNLDGVIRAYADALRAGSQRPDDAFNLELVVRLRAELAGGKRKGLPAGELDNVEKSEANMHGDPGEPPKDMKVEQFQIRIPMDPKDFRSKEDTSAGTGQIRKRRG